MKVEEEIGRLLRQQRLTLGVAESASGGLISHLVTNVSGSSDYFMGGVVSYDNEVKKKLLGVKAETLEKFGAVSEQTAREMAEGVRRVVGVDIGLADTGIAGPSGGSAEKPVGLVYVGLSSAKDTQVRRFVFQGDRGQNKESFAQAALELLRVYLAQLVGPAKQGLPERHVVTSFLEYRGKILLLRRSEAVGSYQGRWAGVSGYLEPGKTPYAQALLEIAEETGLGESDVELLKEGDLLPIDDEAMEHRWLIHPYRFRVKTRASKKMKTNWEHTEVCWINPADLSGYDTVPQLAAVWQRVEPV